MKKEQLYDLMNHMTLEEKIGQMVQITGDIFLQDKLDIITGPLANLELSEENLYQVGSILNVLGSKRIRKIQDQYLAKSRLKIPLLFMADVINGYKIALPIPLAQGCSWDLETIKIFTQIALEESNIAGANVNFSPMVDLVRDARWGRVMETLGGEDPFLGEQYAKQVVLQYQGNNISEKGKIAACVKHFAAYGAVESGRDYNTVDMSEREFRQYYLPAYKAAIDSGVEMVMTSFNIINGIPATVNQWLLQDILKKELGFKGIVISDYNAIGETVAHGVANDLKEAAYLAIQAGVDIDMMSKAYIHHLKDVVKEKPEIEDKINESVWRILDLKNRLGLFENPYGDSNYDKEISILMNKENLKEAKKRTTETFVLLKNKNKILPIEKTNKIALIGPYADNMGISGSWCIYSDKKNIATIKKVLEEKIGQENVFYHRGSNVLTQKEINEILSAEKLPLVQIENEEAVEERQRREAIEVAKKADIILLAIGEHYRQSGEACSRSTLKLPQIQLKLLEELAKLNKPIIVVLFNGRPLELKQIEEKIDALLEVWFPGTMGAEAIIDVLLGEENPSGRLTMSFPQTVGQCPIYYNHYQTGRPHHKNERFVSRYQDIPTQSYYPFGYGLSYSEFSYSQLKLDKKIMKEGEKIVATVQVKNESNISGKEVIQLYIQDKTARVVRPVKELKTWRKVHFKAKEEKEIEFEITKDMLKYWNDKLQYQIEEGEFIVYVGRNSQENLKESFEYKN